MARYAAQNAREKFLEASAACLMTSYRDRLLYRPVLIFRWGRGEASQMGLWYPSINSFAGGGRPVRFMYICATGHAAYLRKIQCSDMAKNSDLIVIVVDERILGLELQELHPDHAVDLLCGHVLLRLRPLPVALDRRQRGPRKLRL